MDQMTQDPGWEVKWVETQIRTVRGYETMLRVYLEGLNKGILDVPGVWLRDHCQCSVCINLDTGQRKADSYADNVMRAEVVRVSGRPEDHPWMTVLWNDGHVSRYNKTWLIQAFTGRPEPETVNLEWPKSWFYTSKPPSDLEHLPSVLYDEYIDDPTAAISTMMTHIHAYGFAFMLGTPHEDPLFTKDILESIGPIRNTHYGGFYDFTADLSSRDTAYTAEALAPHTDTTYFSEPVGLQAFHMLSHTEGVGGQSQLIDGFRAMRELDEDDRDLLASVKLYAHSSGNEGVSIVGDKFSVIEREEGSDAVKRVRWNNDDRCRFDEKALREGLVERWYHAARNWSRIVSSQDARWSLEFQLQPGQLLVFDNWRVLHGRSAFSGKRRMCGAYIGRDDYVSRLKHALYGREEVVQKHVY